LKNKTFEIKQTCQISLTFEFHMMKRKNMQNLFKSKGQKSLSRLCCLFRLCCVFSFQYLHKKTEVVTQKLPANARAGSRPPLEDFLDSSSTSFSH
jgi:hypothetical protein